MAEPTNNFQSLLKHLSILKSLRDTSTLPVDAAEAQAPPTPPTPPPTASSEWGSAPSTGKDIYLPPEGPLDPILPIAHLPPQQQQLAIEALKTLSSGKR